MYRFTVTRQQILDWGQSDQDADGNAGVFTYTLRDGSWTYEQQPAVPGRGASTMTTCGGWYAVRGRTASFTTTTEYAGGACSPPTWSARWTLTGTRLTWSEVSVKDFAVLWTATPWQRIAG